MYFIEDTRQKAGHHGGKHQYWSMNGHKVLRCKLPFGDYAPPPRVAVDTKENMSEIAGNIGTASEHRRFRDELKAAQAFGCKLVILVENDEGIESVEDVRLWVNPRLEYSPKAITGERLSKAMKTMEERYNVRFEFCAPDEAGRRVVELLEEYDGQDTGIREAEGRNREDSG